MRLNRNLPGAAGDDEADPRLERGGQVIDLATRSVLPVVTQRSPGREGLGMFAGMALAGVLGLATLWSMDRARTARSDPRAASVEPLAQRTPAIPPAAITPLPAPGLVRPLPPLPLGQTTVAPALAGNPAASPTIVFDAGTMPAANPVQAPVPGVSGTVGTTGNGNEDFAGRIGGVGGGAAVASASFDPATTVTQGTLIPAILETAIDTDVPGYVRAVVSADVRSFDGRHVLAPRSSRLIGQYRSGLQGGQKRAYVIWTRLIRPDGVAVNIGSPAVGFAGEAGLAGKVNTHFFERFGSAMLLSVIGGLGTIGGNASVVITGGSQSAAAAAVGQTAQIGPTVRVRQGQPIRVFTARDLDFSKVGS